jgi:hypothetical protein
MSKLAKYFAILFLLAGAIAIVPGTAFAQRHHGGGHHGGGWHGGGFRGGGFRGGWGPGFGWGYPYYYGGPYYYGYGPACGWVRVRVLLRSGRTVPRRVWRCW